MGLLPVLLSVSNACSFPDYVFEGPGNSGAGGAGNAGLSGTLDQAGATSGAGNLAGDASGGANGGVGGSAGGGDAQAGEGGAPPPAQTCESAAFLPKDCECDDFAEHAHLFCTTRRSQVNANAQCGAYQMQLVRIETPAENDFILERAAELSMHSDFQYFWIGASSVGHPGTWAWPDGSVFWEGDANGAPKNGAYFDWRTGSPANTSSESCVDMDAVGWVDASCSDSRAYVCEWY